MDAVALVAAATTDEPWGATVAQMQEIANCVHTSERALGSLFGRLQLADESWRSIYKALLVIEFILKHTPNEETRQYMVSHLSNIVKCESSVNQAVRDKARAVIELVDQKKQNTS
ncbi:hypothetical protein Pelo_13583 [Pelomyxa schiedti]|nr:hypothetical protein Pelo_13583 [Pelomyxa schiedti]